MAAMEKKYGAWDFEALQMEEEEMDGRHPTRRSKHKNWPKHRQHFRNNYKNWPAKGEVRGKLMNNMQNNWGTNTY